MDVYRIVKQLLKESGGKMSDLQGALGGITLQSLNASLHGNMSLERFEKIVKRCGYVLMIGKVEEGRAVQIRTLEQIRKEWEK